MGWGAGESVYLVGEGGECTATFLGLRVGLIGVYVGGWLHLLSSATQSRAPHYRGWSPCALACPGTLGHPRPVC